MPDETFSRSMLVRLPEFAAAPRVEMIARFTGGSPAWIEASEPLARFLGKRPGDLAGERFHDLLHPDDRALAEDEFRQAAAQGERHDFVLRLRAGDGQWHYLRIHTQARYEADGRVNHIRCHFKDVTDRVRAEEELRRASLTMLVTGHAFGRSAGAPSAPASSDKKTPARMPIDGPYKNHRPRRMVFGYEPLGAIRLSHGAGGTLFAGRLGGQRPRSLA